jgi:hypothetical protein
MFVKPAYASSLENIYTPAQALGGTSATLATLINPLIANILIVSGVVALATIFFAGFSYVTSNGDKGKVEQSQQMLNYGILGLVVVATAFIITRIIGSIIGFRFF